MTMYEPDWVGTMEFTCPSDNHRKMITPAMSVILRSFSDEPVDPWASTRTAEQVEQMRLRMMQSRVNDLLREWARIEGMDRRCGWEGEAECYVYNGRLLWTCPACGDEHEEPADADVPDRYDTVKEAEGWA